MGLLSLEVISSLSIFCFGWGGCPPEECKVNSMGLIGTLTNSSGRLKDSLNSPKEIYLFASRV